MNKLSFVVTGQCYALTLCTRIMAAVAEGTSFNQSAHGGRHGSCDSDMDTMYPYVSCDATTESWQSEQVSYTGQNY